MLVTLSILFCQKFMFKPVRVEDFLGCREAKLRCLITYDKGCLKRSGR